MEASAKPNAMLENALDHIGDGFYIFPCKRNKQPYTDHGFNDATTEVEMIHKWWKQWPTANIGIDCGRSNIVVLDFDNIDTYNKMLKEHPEYFNTRTIKTGRGGKHVYYKKPNGFKIKSVSSKMPEYPGLDIKADGGYVIGPGSENENGPYIMENDSPISEIPGGVLALLLANGFIDAGHKQELPMPRPLSRTDKTPGGDYWVKKYVAESHVGERNKMGAYLAAQLKAEGMSESEAQYYMLDYQRSVDNSRSPYTEREALNTLKYVYNNYPAKEPVVIEDHKKQKSAPVIIDDIDYNLTDVGNGKRLKDKYQDGIKHCYDIGKWLVWNDKYWKTDKGDIIVSYAKNITSDMIREAADLPNTKDQNELIKHALDSETASRIKAMIEMAKSEVPIDIEVLDNNKYKFNALNYTLDLSPNNKEVKLLGHNKLDFITKMSNVEYDKDAKCPKWLEFLDLVFNGNQNIINFMKRSLGSCLTGDCGDQAFFIMWGSGNNGKSTMVNTINKILGEYCDNIPAESLMINKNADDKHNALADLPGIRFLTIPEGEEEGRFNESLIKIMTGNDWVKTRKLFHDFFKYMPQYKPFFYTNHKPDIRGVDHAIWRRIMLIPFNVEVVEKLKSQNKPRIANYEDILFNEEAAGILNWLIEGWYEKISMGGLCPPDEVKAAINEYKSSLDSIQRWIDEQCLKFEPGNPDLLEPFSAIFNTYNHWAVLNGEPTYKSKGFAKRLDDKQLTTKIGSGNVKFRQGLKINEKLLITDSYRSPQKFLNASCVQEDKKNESLSVIGNSDDNSIGNSSVTLDQNERINIIKNFVRLQAKVTVSKSVPLRIIIGALKTQIDEDVIRTEVKKLAAIGELLEVEPEVYQPTE